MSKRSKRSPLSARRLASEVTPSYSCDGLRRRSFSKNIHGWVAEAVPELQLLANIPVL